MFTFALKKTDPVFAIQLPDNKSLRIREMVTAYVLRGEIPAVAASACRDVRVVGRALRTVAGAANASSTVVVDVADCGAAYRFLMPLLALTPGQWLLTGSPRLLQRPIAPLVSVLIDLGADIRQVDDGWLVAGRPLRAESLEIDASRSSQMASALVLAAPLLGLKSLRLTSADIPSLSYLRMTLACTRDFPVSVPGVSLPETPLGAPGDWSAALFWFAHACLHPENEYRLAPLSLDSIQPDAAISKWFSDLGMVVSSEGSSVLVRSDSMKGVAKLSLDVRDNLDTVPVMAALAALLPADITFRNVGNLRYKESDRLNALVTQLAPYAGISLDGDMMRVVGKGTAVNARAVFDTCHDHRLAMAFLLFGPSAKLNDTACLDKSYPGLEESLLLVQRGFPPEAEQGDFREETEQCEK